MIEVPYIREIGFLVIILAGMFVFGLYMPKLATAVAGVAVRASQKPVVKTVPKLEYDNVLWLDTGRYNDGPFCPKDKTRLMVKNEERNPETIRDTIN
jgi:hypothetical protein